MNATPAIIAMQQVWDRRPRRQLDYSMLSQDSIDDIKWTTDMLSALIAGMKDINTLFPTEIVLQVPLKNGSPVSAEPLSSHFDSPDLPSDAPEDSNAPQIEPDVAICNVCGTGVIRDGGQCPKCGSQPSQPDPAPAPDSVIPSSPVNALPETAQSNDSQGGGEKPARSVLRRRRKPGKRGKSSAVAAKPAVAPLETPVVESSSPSPAPTDTTGMSDPQPEAPEPTDGSELT